MFQLLKPEVVIPQVVFFSRFCNCKQICGRGRGGVSYSKTVDKQEAQLSQRCRAMLQVIEYFAKSLKVTQSHLK